MTTLGSCIAACLWDRNARIGGLNHFMLPEGGEGSGRYGAYAMELLINEMMKRGASRSSTGGQDLRWRPGDRRDGHHEHRRAQYDFRNGLPQHRAHSGAVSKDVLDIYPRKVCFLPASGKAMVKRLAPARAETLLTQEKAALKTTPAVTGGGSVDLF